MALFNRTKAKSSKTTYFAILRLVLVLGFFVLFANSSSRSNLEHEKTILTNALNRAITQCYALEGIYPYTLFDPHPIHSNPTLFYLKSI